MTPSLMPGLDYCAVVFWGSRAETPEQLAERWLKLIARLQEIDPIFERWYTWPSIRLALPFDTEIAPLAEKIAAYLKTSDKEESSPSSGYQLFAHNNTASRGGHWPRNFEIHMFAGRAGDYPLNKISLRTDYGVRPDPGVVTYAIFKNALLALAETFEARLGFVDPPGLMDIWPNGWEPRQGLPLAWISYIAPQFSSLITPPAMAIVEHRPDGGLLMAATDETFDTSNPAHLAVAREIEAAEAPFNALPYPWGRNRSLL